MNTKSHSIFTTAISELIQNKAPLVKVLLIPFITANLMSLSTFLVFDTVFLFFIIYLFTSMAITIHRIILLGPASVHPWGISPLGFREFYYALHVSGLGIVLYTLINYCWPYITSVISVSDLAAWRITITMVGTLVAMLWVFSRLSLVLPAIAVNQGVSFTLSWKITKNHQLLILLAAAVFPVTIFIILAFLSIVLVFLPFGDLIVSFLDLTACLLLVAMLSIAYRIIYTDYFNQSLVQTRLEKPR